MYKHVAEAFVLVPYAARAAEQVCNRSSDFFRTIEHAGEDKLIDFGDARAILRSTDEGLFFRVEAHNLITFYGVRTLLQGRLSAIMTFESEAVEWHPAGSVPFGTIQGGPGDEKHRAGER